jgi:F-type H+-transporting ATPase subunit O
MFSTTASAQAKLVKAPIQLFGMEGRYAHALYSAASKEKQLDTVEKELSKVKVNRKTFYVWVGGNDNVT